MNGAPVLGQRPGARPIVQNRTGQSRSDLRGSGRQAQSALSQIFRRAREARTGQKRGPNMTVQAPPISYSDQCSVSSLKKVT